MSTYIPRATEVRNDWFVLDAEDQILGRVATRAAMVLMGKHKPDYTPFLKTGDHVIVVNADKIKVTGAKEDAKMYRRHSGYPGGLHESTLRKLRQEHPERVLQFAIQRMLPKNKIGRQLATRLKVYTGAEHPHEAQTPKKLELSSIQR